VQSSPLALRPVQLGLYGEAFDVKPASHEIDNPGLVLDEQYPSARRWPDLCSAISGIRHVLQDNPRNHLIGPVRGNVSILILWL